MGYLKKLLLIIAFFIISPTLHAIPIIDASDLNESKELYGPWAFSPEIINSISDSRLHKQTVKLPLIIESILGKSRGEATFALYLKTTPNIPLTIKVKHPFTVWRLYMDSHLIASSGKFGESSQGHKAEVSHNMITFTPTNNMTLLMIQIANSQHEYIDFYGVPTIAPEGILEQQHINSFTLEAIITVLLILVGLYHIGLFTARKQDKATLWFGLMCLAVALRMSTTGEQILVDIFPNISWELLLRLDYVSGCVSLPLFVWYLGSLYPKHIWKSAKYIYLFLGGIFLSLCTLFPTLFFTTYLFSYELFYLTFILYTIVVLYISLKAHETGSALAFITFVILSLSIIHDFLPNTRDLAPYGFVFYLMAQAAILLLRYANAFKIIEQHTDELEVLVLERTKELTALVSQRELLLRELTHRVKNNLQFIISLLWIQRKEADDKTRITLKTLESQIQSIAAVHESLCSKNTIAAIEIHDYIRKLILSLQQLHREVEIILDSREAIYIKTDHTVSLGLIINELVTNHMKYSNPTAITPIHISIHQSVDFKTVLHYNDGIDHREIFANIKTSSFGLPKLGWPMIKEFVKQMDGEIIPYHDHLELHFSACEYI
jgi:two-component sensor histidine kinase